MRAYGCRKDSLDLRDRFYTRKAMRLPSMARLPLLCMPPVWDQGELGSCTAWATGGCAAYLRACNKEPTFIPSARFLYYNTREIEGTVLDDSGAEIRDAVKAIVKKGICADRWCSYDIKSFAVKPKPWAYWMAYGDMVKSYERIGNGRLNDIKACIVQGIPVVFGFVVFESFEGDEMAKTGLLRMPGSDKKISEHAVWAYGYDDNIKIWDQKGGVFIRNSWAEDWGSHGNFVMPYAFISDPELASDFWAIRSIS